MFVDTHCHLTDDKYEDFNLIYQNLVENDISIAINMGCDLSSSIAGKELAEKYDKIYFGVGVHPSEIDKFSSSDFDEFVKLSKNDKCLAIGEIGLDYHYDNIDKESQKKLFVSQLELAKTLKLPVSIHSRDCTEDMLKLLKENKNLLEYGAVMHCFSGSLETAKILLNLGLFISFSGTLTFKNAKNLLEVANYLPLDKCLTETDSPYLSPEPFRGKLNEPKNVKFVLSKLAFIKNLSVEKMADIVLENTKNLFYKLKK